MKKATTLANRLVGPLMSFVLIFALTACSTGKTETATTPADVVENSNPTAVSATSAEPTATVSASASVADALAENDKTHEDADDYTWDSASAISIALNSDSITVNGDGVTVDGSKAIITSAGTYNLSGSLVDGQIIVNTADKEVVRLILNGVDLRNSTSAPISIMDAKKVVIVLAENTENTVTDGTEYVFENPEEDEPNAAIFSKADLTIYGTGSLTVNGNYNDGIASKDGLIIASGTITVNAADDGIRGKDYLVVKAGTITINAQGDGLKSDDEEDATRGYISIEAGVIHVNAGGDAITAQTDVLVTAGELTLVSGGGSSKRVDETTSAKGIKGVVNVNIDGGTFNIDSADDTVHTNGNLVITAGTFTLSSGDDGMHADSTLTINGGDFQITRSYEGIESAVITINAGNIHIVSSDDGINVAAGNDGSGTNQGGRPGRGPGQDAFTYTGNYYLYINGGYIVVDAAGDGLDINGAIKMTDGIVLVNGPTEQMNGPLDYDGGFNITGGFIVAAGSAGMAQTSDASSSQHSILVYFTAVQPGGTLIHIQNSAGEDILTFTPTKAYQSLAFSSPKLVNGETYEIYIEGSSTGAVNDGLYQGGTYTGGTKNTSFKISEIVTMVGSGGNFRRP